MVDREGWGQWWIERGMVDREGWGQWWIERGGGSGG